MPGRPIYRKMVADIEAAGGVEVAVLDELRNGESLTAIAKTYGVGRSVMWRFLKKNPERYAAYEQAQRDGAAGMADKGQELLKEAAETVAKDPSAHVQATRHRAQYLQWHAGVMDRKKYGTQDKTPQVTVSIEHLHLGALQAGGSPESQVIPIGEAKVITDGIKGTEVDNGLVDATGEAVVETGELPVGPVAEDNGNGPDASKPR